MQILIREMQLNEKRDVEELFKRSLSVVDRIVFHFSFDEAQKSALKKSGGTLIAEFDHKIVGAVSMRIQTVKNTRIGYIDALVTDKEFRGRGTGKSLVDGAILWLEERGCEVIYATADRYNSPSWNTFIHRGFHPYEIPQQIRYYKLNFLRLWFMEFYFIGFGTFFLRRDRETKKPKETNEAWHLLAAFFGVSIVWWIQILRSQEFLMLFPVFFAVVAVSILVHELPQKIVAHNLGLETTFKAWGSGIFVGWLLALIGAFFPAYGSTYVKKLDWWYNPKKDKTGLIFTIGLLASLTIGFAFWAIQNLTTNNLLATSAKVGYAINLMIVIFNLIPIQAAGGFVWDGKKIFTWNKTIWSALVMAAIALIMLDTL